MAREERGSYKWLDYFDTPPRTVDVLGFSDFSGVAQKAGSQAEKSLDLGWFRHEVRDVFVAWHPTQVDVLADNVIADEVISDVDVLGPLVTHWVRGNCLRRLAVSKDW